MLGLVILLFLHSISSKELQMKSQSPLFIYQNIIYIVQKPLASKQPSYFKLIPNKEGAAEQVQEVLYKLSINKLPCCQIQM